MSSNLKALWIEDIQKNKTILGFQEWKKAHQGTTGSTEEPHLISVDLNLIAKRLLNGEPPTKGPLVFNEPAWYVDIIAALEEEYEIKTILQNKMVI